MRVWQRRWSGKKAIGIIALAALAVMALNMVFEYGRAMLMGEFEWPKSAHIRIEDMASILRRIRAPASWCYPSENPANIYVSDPNEEEQEFGRCMSSIKPVSDFYETDPGYYVKRFYRGEVEGKFCEFTLSTVNSDDRIVGSDCYFGLFPKEKDRGVGMTDDKFG
jgi:hypothetical protein